MKTGFKTRLYDSDGDSVDLGDLFIPKQLFSSGGLWGFGSGADGELGNNAITSRSSPVQTVSAGNNWKQVATGLWSSAAIKTDGTLWTWGYNGYANLADNTTVSKSSPVQTIAGGTNWKQVSSKMWHTGAIKTDGTLWLWGYNDAGQLGNNTSGNVYSSPVQTVAGGTNWKQVSVGTTSTAAIKTDGTLWLWGMGADGQLGNNAITSRSSPVQTIAAGTNWKQVSMGSGSACAIKTDGTLWSWGYNGLGSLGDNTSISKSSPVQTVFGGTDWKQVSVGDYHVGAIKTNGTLWLWGRNNYGELGNNSQGLAVSSPIQTVSAGTNWKSVGCSLTNTAAIKTDGTLWLWGQNQEGQLGNNTATNRSSPTQTVSGGTDWKQVSSGGYHTFAIREI